MDELTIEAGQSENQYFHDLWHYRQLFYILAWRDLAVRYKQTVIGVAWALIRPLLTMLVLTVVFGKIAKLPSEGAAPYAILVYCGMLPWQFFSTAMSEASNSLVTNSNLVAKVYFPRLILPASSVIVSLIDFLISFTILIGMMVWYQYWPDWRILLLPCFLAMAFFTAMGLGLWFCALNVEYRDFRYIVPFIVQLGVYVSPVGFSTSVVPDKWRLLYSINPMVGVIDGFRWSLLGNDVNMYMPGMVTSVLLTVMLCVSGLWYFRKMEKTFADVI